MSVVVKGRGTAVAGGAVDTSAISGSAANNALLHARRNLPPRLQPGSSLPPPTSSQHSFALHPVTAPSSLPRTFLGKGAHASLPPPACPTIRFATRLRHRFCTRRPLPRSRPPASTARQPYRLEPRSRQQASWYTNTPRRPAGSSSHRPAARHVSINRRA
jgi:hypothetical protein